MKTFHPNKAVLLLPFLLMAITMSGEGIAFRNIDNSHGLPHNTVFSLAQDVDGFIWIGTRFGLCRYDTGSFITYDANNSILKNHSIRDILPDRDSSLFVATEYGVYKVNRFSGAMKELPVGLDGNLPRAVSLCFYNDNILIVGSEDYGVFAYNGEESRHFNFIESATSVAFCQGSCYACSPSDGLVRFDMEGNCSVLDRDCKPQTLFPDIEGNLWIGTLGNGLLCYQPDGNVLKNVNAGNDRNEKIIKDIVRKGRSLYLATEGGLVIYDIPTGDPTVYKYHPEESSSIADNALYSILCDSEGGVWIGTYFRGISYEPPIASSFEAFPETKDLDICGNAVSSFCECGEDNIIVASEDNGFCFFKPSDHSFLPFGKKDRLSYNNIHDVCIDDSGRLWIGTYLHGIDIYNPKDSCFGSPVNTGNSELFSDSILRIYKDYGGDIHIGTTLGASVYRSSTGKIERLEITRSGVIRDVFQDSRGNIWYASMNKGLFRFNPVNSRWDVFDRSRGALPSDKTVCVKEDEEGYIWVGTEGYGIIRYDYGTDSFTKYDRNDNLPDNYIFSIETSDGYLWLGTTKGLCRYDYRTHESYVYSKADGLRSQYFNYNASWKSSTGVLYFGTVDGFLRFDPGNLKINECAPRAAITSLLATDRERRRSFYTYDLAALGPKGNRLVFPASQNNLTFNFVSLSFSHPDKNRFRYYLEGYEKDFGPEKPSMEATYNNLHPGEYRFHVVSSNDGGVWGEEIASCQICVKAPFWIRPLAISLYALLFLASIFLAIRSFQEKEKEKHRKQLQEKELEAKSSKIAFFTNITHEIKTPLALLRIPLDILMKEVPNMDKNRRYLDTMDRNLKWLDKLVKELLEFRKLEENEYHLHFENVDIKEFISNIVSVYDDYAVHNGIDLRFIHNLDGKLVARIDPKAIAKVLNNLITNAMKFTRDRVVVALRHVSGYDDFGIFVYDNGNGIEKGQEDYIVKPFAQIDNEKKHRGIGIGLAYSKSLLELHGGNLAIRSEYGKFFSASFFLPIGEVSEEDATCQVLPPVEEIDFVDYAVNRRSSDLHLTQSGTGNRENGHILVVEDNVEFAEMVLKYFEGEYCVGYSNNGDDALRYIRLYHPDIVISDIMMAGMDGIELCSRIKEDPQMSHTIVIMLTAKTGEEDRLSALQTGANAYFSKESSMDELKAVVCNFIKSRQMIMDWVLKGTSDVSTLELTDLEVSANDKKFLMAVSEIFMDNIDNPSFSMEDLAHNLGMSKSLVYLKLKKLMNMSASEYLQTIRMKRAAELIGQTERGISEIAYDMGYSDPNYFSRSFKKHFGITPTEFRKTKDNNQPE